MATNTEKLSGATSANVTAAGTTATVGSDEMEAIRAQVDQLTRELATANSRADDMEAQLRETRGLAEGREDEIASLRAENEDIRRTLGGSADDAFARKSDVDRVRTDLETLRNDRADTQVNISDGTGMDEGVPGFEGGLMKYIIETYYSSDVLRYRRAVDAERARQKS